ncbi:helix-turn-helix domain-containing protein [Sinomonas sp. RB5]
MGEEAAVSGPALPRDEGGRTGTGGRSHAIAALAARQEWAAGEYSRAGASAALAAGVALDAGDAGVWWEMAYLQAQCLMKQGRLAECRRIVEGLLGHPIAVGAEGPAILAHQMLAAVCHALGQLGPALCHAREAVRLGARLPAGSAVRVAALRALIGVLADSGLLEEAWGQCGVLGALLGEEPAGRLRGEGEWVIGNLAFMRADCEEGLSHHGRAAELLSAVGEIGLWGQFNKASAAVRLASGITGPGTLEAIQRAEAAFAIVGAGRRDQLELAFVRARWHYLNGQAQEAVGRLEEIGAGKDLLGPRTAGDIALLHGRALRRLGRDQEADEAFDEARRLLEGAGLPERSREAADASSTSFRMPAGRPPA